MKWIRSLDLGFTTEPSDVVGGKKSHQHPGWSYTLLKVKFGTQRSRGLNQPCVLRYGTSWDLGGPGEKRRGCRESLSVEFIEKKVLEGERGRKEGRHRERGREGGEDRSGEGGSRGRGG